MSPAAITRAVQAGRLYRQYRGVYSLMPTLTREGEWLAAVYAMRDGAALAALNAAVVHESSRFKPVGIIVAVPRRRRPQGFKVIVGLDARDIRVRNGIPVTSIERTLDDLARRMPPEQVANVIHDAAYRRLFSPARARERGNPRLNRAIDMYLAGSAGTKSDLEDRFMALVREGRFHEPIINTHILGIEVDFRWGGYCVMVDGPNHTRAPTRAKDEADQAKLEAHGLTVVRFTEAAIELEPRLVLAELAARLRRARRR